MYGVVRGGWGDPTPYSIVKGIAWHNVYNEFVLTPWRRWLCRPLWLTLKANSVNTTES